MSFSVTCPLLGGCMCFDSDLHFIHFSLLCNILVCSHVLIHSPLGGYLGFFQFFFFYYSFACRWNFLGRSPDLNIKEALQETCRLFRLYSLYACIVCMCLSALELCACQMLFYVTELFSWGNTLICHQPGMELLHVLSQYLVLLPFAFLLTLSDPFSLSPIPKELISLVLC